jgi:hypothetical protein
MDHDSLRLLIRQKLADDRLPQDSMPRIWGGPADADMCDACDRVIPGGEYVIEGVSWFGSDKRAVQFHVLCFAVWDEERQPPGR